MAAAPLSGHVGNLSDAQTQVSEPLCCHSAFSKHMNNWPA